MDESRGPMPLSHLTVLDLTHYRAGPTATRQLGDWGADVIRIEAPPAPDTPENDLMGTRNGSDYQNLQRNKRSITLNLKEADGRDVFFKLVAKADIVVENYRVDVKHRLGIDYEACREVNKRIIYGSISGFGQTGPRAARPAIDQILQGMGGLMSITGLPGQGPVRAGIPICDLCAGQFLFEGILMAAMERERTGEGQWVQTSLLEAVLFMLDLQGARWLIDGEVPDQAGNSHPVGVVSGLQPTKDGYVNTGGYWPSYLELIGAHDLLKKPEYATKELRYENRHQLRADVAEASSKLTSDELTEILDKAGIPVGPVYTVDQAFADEQVEHLGLVKTAKHPRRGPLRMMGQPMTMSATPQSSEMRMAAPDLGEHTDAVLESLGYDADVIRDLRDRNVI